MTIDMIAEKTGYSNANVFRKAYKRFFGKRSQKGEKNTVDTCGKLGRRTVQDSMWVWWYIHPCDIGR